MKIGDKVKIRQWDDMVNEFGLDKEDAIVIKGLGFIDDMKFWCGQTLTISEVLDDGSYRMEEDVDGYRWCEEMFEEPTVEIVWEYQPKHEKEQAKDLTKINKHAEICAKLNVLYKMKNQKYGDSFGISVKKYGLISALTRISDKFNRFEQLVLEGSNGTDDETLLDTCLDAANYFIMTAIELEDRGK